MQGWIPSEQVDGLQGMLLQVPCSQMPEGQEFPQKPQWEGSVKRAEPVGQAGWRVLVEVEVVVEV